MFIEFKTYMTEQLPPSPYRLSMKLIKNKTIPFELPIHHLGTNGRKLATKQQEIIYSVNKTIHFLQINDST